MTRPLLHHISLGVSDLQAMAAFYDAALAPLGQVRVWDGPRSVGYGLPGQGDQLLLNLREGGPHAPGDGFHLAFSAPLAPPSTRSTPRRSPTAATTTARPGCGNTMARTTMPPSSSIPMVIGSKP